MYGAVMGGKVRGLQMLVQREMSLAPHEHVDGQTLLMTAAADDRHAVAEWLLRKGLPVNATRRTDGGTALHVAVNRSHIKTTEVLLAHGVDVMQYDSSGRSALQYAANAGRLTCVGLLLAAGAAVTHIDLYEAVQCKHTAVVKLLLEYGAAAVVNEQVASSCACCAGEQRPLVMASRDAATLKLLLTAGANVFAATHISRTCLHVAAVHGYPAPVVCLLIKAGVDLHAVDNSGQTAAQLAHEHGHELLASLLIRAAQE
jgi:uncharacterized protein